MEIQDRKVYMWEKRSFYFPWSGKRTKRFIPSLLSQILKVDTSSLGMKLDYVKNPNVGI